MVAVRVQLAADQPLAEPVHRAHYGRGSIPCNRIDAERDTCHHRIDHLLKNHRHSHGFAPAVSSRVRTSGRRPHLADRVPKLRRVSLHSKYGVELARERRRASIFTHCRGANGKQCAAEPRFLEHRSDLRAALRSEIKQAGWECDPGRNRRTKLAQTLEVVRLAADFRGGLVSVECVQHEPSIPWKGGLYHREAT